MIGNKESYLNLWRAVIGLTAIDGVVTDQEKEWLDTFLVNIRLEGDELEILKNDMKDPKNPSPFIDKVTDAAHLSQLHHLANIIFKSDNFDHKESVYLDKINKLIESKIDMMSAMRKSQDHIAELEMIKKQKQGQIKGFFLHLVDIFKK
ncbi:MAG: hypothetical protein BM556_13130 [Bacteriovorax sp. MedPE-SWde]|nr:MAG: hypothetical protein BM556_13130 [Bacteriovorax sp. MedPE-SWde]